MRAEGRGTPANLAQGPMADGGLMEGCRLQAAGPDNVRGGGRLQWRQGREHAVPGLVSSRPTATGVPAEYGVRPESSRSARAVRRDGRTRSRRAGSSRALAIWDWPEASLPVRGEP